MRPSDDFLNEFYDLADFDKTKRVEAINRLLTKIKLDPSVNEYCVERLITGLSSTRGASRLGLVKCIFHISVSV
ncbi:hypothetical protein DICVIV_06983 [Dictyocaulus viviparus]|uniref:Uncharacterized protein n=1 Tax=Dictyocaulus viviparus TaxID=29172 RepID=A0A0D8XX77_DICVI|nr:hypothetical protein DICVIV_06983 [Dictyocaulus viviparus]